MPIQGRLPIYYLITIEIQPALAIAVAWEPFEFQLWLNQLPSTPD
jgi:hypothetical protein